MCLRIDNAKRCSVRNRLVKRHKSYDVKDDNKIY